MSQNQEQENLQQSPQSDQQNKSLFLVSSAIHTKHGVYDAEARLNQTIETCKSIKSRCNADIILLDGGEKSLTIEEKKILSDYIHRFYDFTEEDTVKQIQKIDNWDVVKNMIEVVMFGSFFDLMSTTNLKLPHYDRIFKMSGRYTLTDEFDHDFHLQQEGKIVIRGPYTSQFNSTITGGVTLQYMSRLWSFDSCHLEYIRDTYVDMFNHMNERLNNGGYIDIEHLLYHHLHHTLIVTPKRIGVQGNIAPNGHAIME
jgi:hypothetical protein